MSAGKYVPALLACACFVGLGTSSCSSEPDSPEAVDAGSAGSGASGAGAGGAGAGGSGAGGSGAGGSGGTNAGSGTAGSGTAGSNTAGTASGGSSSAGRGGSGGKGGEGGEAGDAAGGGSAELSEVGVCGHRGEATVTEDEFSGFEEFYLIGEEGFGDDICVVRFDVTRTGEPPSGCPDCEWAHAVKLENPRVVLDENGVCANSELGFDDAMIESIDGSEHAYGYVDEYAGHVSVLMKFDEERELWDAFGTATYDPEESTLKFERRNGFCNYRP